MEFGAAAFGEMTRLHREWDAALKEWAQRNSVSLLFHLRWEGTMQESKKFNFTKHQIYLSGFLASRTVRKGRVYDYVKNFCCFLPDLRYCNRSLDRLSWGKKTHSCQPEYIEFQNKFGYGTQVSFPSQPSPPVIFYPHYTHLELGDLAFALKHQNL